MRVTLGTYILYGGVNCKYVERQKTGILNVYNVTDPWHCFGFWIVDGDVSIPFVLKKLKMLIELIYLTSSDCWNGKSTQLNLQYMDTDGESVKLLKSQIVSEHELLFMYSIFVANIESICWKIKHTHTKTVDTFAMPCIKLH